MDHLIIQLFILKIQFSCKFSLQKVQKWDIGNKHLHSGSFYNSSVLVANRCVFCTIRCSLLCIQMSHIGIIIELKASFSVVNVQYFNIQIFQFFMFPMFRSLIWFLFSWFPMFNIQFSIFKYIVSLFPIFNFTIPKTQMFNFYWLFVLVIIHVRHFDCIHCTGSCLDIVCYTGSCLDTVCYTASCLDIDCYTESWLDVVCYTGNCLDIVCYSPIHRL